MDIEIKSQILAVRDTGKTNMLNTIVVQHIAYDMGFYELVLFIEDNKKEYLDFIMRGEEA